MSLQQSFRAVSKILKTRRSVNEGIRTQGQGNEDSLYHLVALKGGGLLVSLMKEAKQTNDYTILEHTIKGRIRPFLYNGGEGRKIPISKLLAVRERYRNGGESNAKGDNDDSSVFVDMGDANRQEECRETCWRLDKRGTVGETILHLCLLNASTSSLHMDLARRLLNIFPKLIKDIYLSDEYYGENVLHMAIVNEDPRMVKFLLDHRADIHGRCCGRFFHPYDQWESRTDSQNSDIYDVPMETDYTGAVYFGEYPLSFAACLGQVDCLRLLIAKKANPNLQDNNGNTVMHMLVIHDNEEMFKMLHETGLVRLDIQNRQGYTALTLAAHLARKKIYDCIVKLHMSTVWQFGRNYKCTLCPLKSFDSIKPSGHIDELSVLSIVINGENEGHLYMIDDVIINLLKEKWKTFIKASFYRKLVFFFIYYLSLGIVLGLRPKIDQCAASLAPSNITYNQLDEDVCYLRRICRSTDYGRLAVEIFLLMAALVYIGKAIREIYYRRFLFLKTLWRTLPKLFFLLSCGCVIFMGFARAGCLKEFEDVLIIIAILSASPYFFFFLGVNQTIAPFVVMVHKMIVGDIFRFVIIYGIFIMAFAQAFYIAFITSSCDNTISHCALSHQGESITATFTMSVGDFEDMYELFPMSEYTTMVKIMFVFYIILVTWLLVNMLIAMMGNTYHSVKVGHKVAFRQWARVILVMEQSLTPRNLAIGQKFYCEGNQWSLSDHIDTNNLYLQMMSIAHYSDTLCFITRWHESDEDRRKTSVIQDELRAKQFHSNVTYHRFE